MFSLYANKKKNVFFFHKTFFLHFTCLTSTSALFLFSMVIYCVNACGSKSDHDQKQVSTALKPFSIDFHIFDWQFNNFIRLVIFKISFFLPDLYVFVSINKNKSEDLRVCSVFFLNLHFLKIKMRINWCFTVTVF